MKVLIYYKPPKNRDGYEGARLRKTLKGACERSGVIWVDSLMAFPDIAHFISPEDEFKLGEAKAEGIKTVVSVGYCENDPYARFFEHAKDGEGLTLRIKSKRMIEKADAIFVPNLSVKKYLDAQGFGYKTKVVRPAVNLARFEVQSKAERDIFRRYFGVKESEKIVVSTCGYDHKDVIEKIKAVASLCPEYHFYHFGSEKKRHVPLSIRKGAPKNLTFSNLVEDDVYRSAMINAFCFLLVDDCHPDCTTLYEAFASKTGVVAIGEQGYNDIIKKDKNASLTLTPEMAAKEIASFASGEKQETIMAAYEDAVEASLAHFAESLPELYRQIINE